MAVAQAAACRPQSVAVRAVDGELRYGELIDRARGLAALLAARGVATETVVGVFLPRCPGLIVALLGVLEAGGAYLPLDPEYPDARLQFMLRDSGVKAVITQAPLAARLAALASNVAPVFIEDLDDVPGPSPHPPGPSPHPPGRATPENLAYVLYTSGSTGQPKGVEVEHAALANHTASAIDALGFGPGDRTLQFAATSFDTAGEEVWPALCSGGTLVLRDESMLGSPGHFWDRVAGAGISQLNLPTAFWHELTRHPGTLPDCLRVVVIGGEKARTDRLAAWWELAARSPHAPRLVNTYGFTEGAMVSARHELRAGAPDHEASWLGVAVDGVDLHVLGENGRPVSEGDAGELFVGGIGLARGYRNRPDLTAERFVEHPLASARGGRLYRTGDVVRRRDGGALEYVGRADQQVKIRGVRVEPGEVERALLGHPGVVEAVVVAERGRDDDVRLVAWFQPAESLPPPTARELVAFLRERLTEPFVPAEITAVAALPLTPSGKLDRAALRERTPPVSGAVPQVPAALDRHEMTSTERTLATIWQEVMGLGRVAGDDHFFDVGGHSLIATQVASRVRQLLDVDLPLREVFENPRLRQMAAAIERAKGDGTLTPPLRVIATSTERPLSFAQQRLWFLDRIVPEAAGYVIADAWLLRGRLEIAALDGALSDLIDRHEALRTTFPSRGGKPFQVVAKAPDTVLRFEDLRHEVAARGAPAWRGAIQKHAATVFDLAHGPLLRARLLRIGDDEHVLSVAIHHIVFDGWSQGLFASELGALYEARRGSPTEALPDLPVQYADFAAWQRSWLHGDRLERQLRFWRGQLHEAPALALPVDRPRPAVVSDRGASLPIAIDADLTAALRGLGRQAGASLFQVLLAGFVAVLWRWTGQDDIVIGAPIAGRNHRDIEKIIGFFVNSVALRARVDSTRPFADLLEQLRETTLATYDHQDLPFEKLVEELQPLRDPGRHPFFQVTLALHNVADVDLQLGDLDVEAIEIERRAARMDLELHLWEGGDRLEGYALYASDLFAETTIARLTGWMTVLLRAAASEPQVPLARLPIGTPEEIERTTLHLRRDVDFGAPECVHRSFHRQVRKTPTAIAIVAGDESVSFERLARRSSDLAADLRRHGVGPGIAVAIGLDRGIDMVVAMLATLEAGGAYVPLDVSVPVQRLAFMIEDCGARLLFCRGARPPWVPRDVMILDPALPGTHASDDRAIDAASATARRPAAPQDTAYVIYTSGSTGAPKGVAISHAALCNHMRWMRADLPLGGDDRVLQKTPIGFDASVWEIWAPLLEGATLVLAAPDGHRDPRYLVRTLHEQGITVLQVVPSLLQLLVEEDGFATAPRLRRVLCGGELLSVPLRDRFFASGCSAELYNVYGPSETTIHATWHRCAPGEPATAVPIGRPIANAHLQIVDEAGKPVPSGIIGELLVGGAGVGSGYLNRPELDAVRFLTDASGVRTYRTGDLVRLRDDGAIEFLGRRDQQVKLRGHRIELGEIEARLVEHPQVREAAVVVASEEQREPRLIAYVATAPWAPGDSSLQHAHVQQWQSLYEDLYAQPAVVTDATFNTVGWISSFTGEPLPEEHMRDWLDDTVAAIQRLRPRRVLEIGCGTGMILLRIAADCESYFGIDFSDAALATVNSELRARGWRHVRTERRRADDLVPVPRESFDVVILNSVAQYFPDEAYFRAVIAGAIDAAAVGGAVFLGDIRNLALQEAFATAVEWDRARAQHRRDDIRRRVRARIDQEEELLLHPALFAALADSHPRVCHVTAEPRSGIFDNELTRYRYDVTLHLDRQPDRVDAEVLPWPDGESDVVRLRARLLAQAPAAAVIRGIDHRLLHGDLRLKQLLEAASAEDGVDAIATALRVELAGSHRALRTPAEALAWATELGYEARCSWLSADAQGRFDLLLRRPGANPHWRLAALPDRGAPPVLASRPTDARRQRVLATELRDRLAESLPEAMVPAAFVFLEALPRSPSGKLDRRALPGADPGRRELSVEFVAPRDDVERALVDIYRELLDVDSVGIRDDFFCLGGHSLLAVQAVVQIRETLGVELPVLAMFEHRSVAALAGAIEANRTPTDTAPLSFGQQSQWFLEQLHPGWSAYNVADATAIRGPLQVEALRRALRELVARHESLRTTFDQRDGLPYQRVAADGDVELQMLELQAGGTATREAVLEHTLAETAAAPFDLGTGPLLRVLLVRVDSDNHVLLTVFHHIITDGWSQGVWTTELAALYGAFAAAGTAPPPAPSTPYREHAVAERRALASGALDTQLEYWRARLRDLPGLRLPAAKGGSGTGSSRWDLDPPGLLEVQRLARDHEATLFMTLLASWGAVLAAWSGQNDFAIGVPAANRSDSRFAHTIGVFVNTLAIRLDLGGEPTFSQLLGRVRDAVLGGAANAQLPFEKLVEVLQPERSGNRNPLFDAFFGLITPGQLDGRLQLPGVQCSPWPLPPPLPAFDLDLEMHLDEHGLHAELGFERGAVDDETADRLAGSLQRFLLEVAAAPDAPLHASPSLRALAVAEAAVRAASAESPAAAVAVDTAPRNETERRVARLFQDLLEVEQVGRDSDFFGSGGHSLLAVQLCARIRDLSGVEMPVRAIFDHPTPAALSRLIDADVAPAASEPEPIPRGEHPLLSCEQERLWMLDRLQPGDGAFNVGDAIRLEGALDASALEAALEALVARHEALRTSFPERDGVPYQHIRSQWPISLERFDVSAKVMARRQEAAIDLLRRFSRRPFDLQHGPLFRAALLRLGAREHVLAVAAHHIITDARSQEIMLREIANLYRARALGDPIRLEAVPTQPADLAARERAQMHAGAFDASRDYWRRQLTGLSPMHWNGDRPRPRGQAGHHPLRWSPQRTTAVEALARNRGVTTFTVLLAGFGAALQRLTGQRDFGIGVPASMRTGRNTEQTVGLLVNMLVLRLQDDGAGSFDDWLGRARETTLQAYAHVHVPFAQVVQDLRAGQHSRTRLFDVYFNLLGRQRATIDWGPLRSNSIDISEAGGRYDVDLELTCWFDDDALAGELVYDTERVGTGAIVSLARELLSIPSGNGDEPERG